MASIEPNDHVTVCVTSLPTVACTRVDVRCSNVGLNVKVDVLFNDTPPSCNENDPHKGRLSQRPPSIT